ncbi:MAG: TrmH family RNA methyltransferase [Dehalococcoidia bacterium]
MIASHSNSSIKQIRALRLRQERDRSRLFFVEGIRLVAEAIQLQVEIECCVVCPDLLKSRFAREIVQLARDRSVAIIEVTPVIFRGLSIRDGPQGLGAVIRQRWQSLEEVRPGEELCWVALDGVQDPGNLGTVLRTSDAVGGAGVILLQQSTDPYDPSAVRASMGAVFSQRVIRTSFDEFAEWKRRHHWYLTGTSGGAALDYQEISYPTPCLLLMGSEREGLSSEKQSLCDAVVSIPMAGRSDSLNLSVATGVMLYEMFNQSRR